MAETLSPPAPFRPDYPSPLLRERALDLIFPPTCANCRKVGRWICAGCWHDIVWAADHRCLTCHRPWPVDTCARCMGTPSALESITSVAEFDGPAREAVHALKYNGRHAIASMMSRVMAQAVTGCPLD